MKTITKTLITALSFAAFFSAPIGAYAKDKAAAKEAAGRQMERESNRAEKAVKEGRVVEGIGHYGKALDAIYSMPQ